MVKVYVLVVTYNGMKWIEECLNSILNSSVPVIPLVIDNNSTDNTVNFIKTNFPDLILLEQNANLGFGKANNIGLSYALKQNADFVFLLNQDAFLQKHTIENLIQVSYRQLDYGILSPIQLDNSGKKMENYFFKFMAKDRSRGFYSDFVLKNELKEIYPIDFIQAAAWLLPIKTIKMIGGFDPMFYHYGEDDNYCQRVLFHNLKIGVVPNAYIRHDSNKPTNEPTVLFSERHLKDYIKVLQVIYGNINFPFTMKHISEERKKIYRMMLFSFLKLNFFSFIGFLRQLVLLNKNIILIKESRKNNEKIKENYLNLN